MPDLDKAMNYLKPSATQSHCDCLLLLGGEVNVGARAGGLQFLTHSTFGNGVGHLLEDQLGFGGKIYQRQLFRLSHVIYRLGGGCGQSS